MENHGSDLSAAQWRKSSYSNGTGGECVEVASGLPDLVPVRDSKRPQDSTVLFRTPAWTAFLKDLKR